ncbi:hypothetical protein NIASO_02705 [Niabella soli DSM 19437]|uniref:Uncharacterized protein n=1 Tax=Niabella soli DSM 19437 TaxID=929713 RepID=W0F2D4_9BACT|nr:hypothetical protein NIASO_02705 [Niabella soli DSM 19437]
MLFALITTDFREIGQPMKLFLKKVDIFIVNLISTT